jgi:ParB-like chromosome segregation protein Spo0J
MKIKVAIIRCDSGTQSRAAVDEDVVTEYCERMLAGDAFPAVDAFFDGNEYYLGDGFHRVLAANRAKITEIECNVHKGTVTDALWLAIGSNATNGARRTPADKRRAIELALLRFPDKTQEQVAQHVACAQSYVAKVKSELIISNKLRTPTTRKGKDGKSRPTTYARNRRRSRRYLSNARPQVIDSTTVKVEPEAAKDIVQAASSDNQSINIESKECGLSRRLAGLLAEIDRARHELDGLSVEELYAVIDSLDRIAGQASTISHSVLALVFQSQAHEHSTADNQTEVA